MTQSRSSILAEVAAAIVESGYAVLPDCKRRERKHYPLDYRREQLQEAADAFEYINGHRPNRSQLARFAGLSRSSVTRILGAVSAQ